MHIIRLSIRWKMTLLFAGLLATILLLICTIIVFSTRRILLANLASNSSPAVIVATLDQQLRYVLIPCFIGGSLLVLGIGRWLTGLVLRPIAHITATAYAISTSGDLSQRIGPMPVAWDEVGRLAATVDTMLASIDHAFTAQQQFIADASHELKTPLTAILGHANLLRRQRMNHPEIVDEATLALIEEAERMHRLVRDLLAFERTRSSQPMAQQPVALLALIELVLHGLAPLAQHNGITLVFPQPIQPIGPRVWGNADQLRQVMVNIVENALKFTPVGGSIYVRVRCTHLRQSAGVEVRISDTGCGIASDNLPFIFDRFYRADKSRSSLSGGNGLGLAIVHSIIQQHRGVIDVTSELGKGTTFCITLPSECPP